MMVRAKAFTRRRSGRSSRCWGGRLLLSAQGLPGTNNERGSGDADQPGNRQGEAIQSTASTGGSARFTRPPLRRAV
jgi:hypothetical protein